MSIERIDNNNDSLKWTKALVRKEKAPALNTHE